MLEWPRTIEKVERPLDVLMSTVSHAVLMLGYIHEHGEDEDVDDRWFADHTDLFERFRREGGIYERAVELSDRDFEVWLYGWIRRLDEAAERDALVKNKEPGS